jgi:hypothetical protein
VSPPHGPVSITTRQAIPRVRTVANVFRRGDGWGVKFYVHGEEEAFDEVEDIDDESIAVDIARRGADLVTMRSMGAPYRLGDRGADE